jgi:hypothetical protein
MPDLLVMVPTRGRPEQCQRLLGSFRETASPETDILFILDPDDEDTYAGVEWGDAPHGVLAPRGCLRDKLNQAAESCADTYDALMWCGDDHVFRTPGWDRLMLAALEQIGGHGWVYPETVRRRDVPEIWMSSTALVEALGWFFPPMVSHFCGDNAIAELGKRAGLIRGCPEAVVEHLHYTVCDDTERDRVYLDAEQEHGQAGLAAFQQWRATQLPMDVAALRRRFNPDVSWVLSKVA